MIDHTDTWQWRIEVRLAALGVTHAQVAQAAGMSRSTFSTFTKATSANTNTVRKVEDALGVPAGWLVKTATREELGSEAATFQPPDWLKEVA